MPSLNDDRRLSRTLIFRLMSAENKNCEAFWSRLPEKINFRRAGSTEITVLLLRVHVREPRGGKPECRDNVQARSVGITVAEVNLVGRRQGTELCPRLEGLVPWLLTKLMNSPITEFDSAANLRTEAKIRGFHSRACD